jgi:hypothetical protein
MTLASWDIGKFPLTKTSISPVGLPESDAEWRTWEEAQRALKKPEGTDEAGFSEYDPEVWMMGKHAPSHEKYHRPEHEDAGGGGDDDDYEDHEDMEPDEYHIVTRPRDSIHGLNAFNEHPYHAFGHAYTGTPDSAMEMFAEDHPEYDTERYPDTATHEIYGAHLAEHHDAHHRNIAEEEGQFQRIAPHGLQRESPDVIGHRTYRHEEPNGVVHRLWHSPYSANGPGWHTSRHDPSIDREHQPVPWTEHPDNASEDSLGDALAQVNRNRRG